MNYESELAPDFDGVAAFFAALSDPTRCKLCHLLLDGEKCVHELAEQVGLSLSAVSHQLRLLRALRLVRGRKEGRHVYYHLDDSHVKELLRQGLEHVSERRRPKETE